jgi:hypothetical protein
MNDTELSALFRSSRDGEPWPDPLPDPAAIWRRARTAELLAAAFESQERSVRPLRAARGLAAAVAFLAAELAVAAVCLEAPASAGRYLAATGLPLATAALLACTAVPTAALLLRFWRERTAA